MNKMMARASVLAVAFIVSLPLGLAAQDEGYYPYSFARLSYVNGAVYIERTAGLGYEKGEVNFALVQGDRIGTESGQAEIHFGRRNYLRLDNSTKVEFAILPREGEERIKLVLTGGSVYLRVSYLAQEKGVEIHTPDASFYVLDAGLYRFDVRPGGETVVSVREGSLEAAAEDGSVLVRDGETLTAAGGRFLNGPEYGYAAADAFDDWNGGRDAQSAERSERQYLPSGIEEYEEELDRNGHWIYERPYGHVWVPYVSHYNEWRPYYHGRWAWYPGCGWTWVPAEPWGWTVYHYGRWNWRFGLGWYWIPRSHWGPAWVHWWSDGLYVGWCPLTWYNRPAYLFHDRFYDRYDDRYYSAHNRAMTVVRRDHLQSPDVGRRHLASSDLDRIGKVELRDRQPAIRPAVDNTRPQAVAARRALADPSGAQSRVREVAPSRSLSSSRSRPGASGASVRSGERGNARADGDRDVLARPSVRNDSSGSGVVRTYPSGRSSGERGGNGVTEYRRGAVVSPDRGGDAGKRGNESRVSRPRGQDPGPSRTSTVREPQRSQASERSSSSSSSSRPSARMSAPASQSSRTSPSVSRPSASSRPSPSSSSRSGSSRGSISSPSRSSNASVSRPSSFGSSSSGRSSSAPRSTGSSSGRSIGAPRSGGSSSGGSVRSGGSSSSGRSYSAPRSTGSSSGRSVGAPRSGGSSSRGSVRSGGSSSSGRSGSSSSKSSGSSSKSGSAKRKD